MKRILFLTFILLSAMASCSKSEFDGTGNGTGPDGNRQEEVEEATIRLLNQDVTIGGSMFNTAEVSVATNQTKVTAVSNDTWMTVTMMGKVVIITASENNETGSSRTGTVTVTAGKGDNTASAILTVTQSIRDASTETPVIQITGGPEDMESAKDSETYVTFTTNCSEVSVSFAEEAASWLSYDVTDGKVTFTALSENVTGLFRTAEITLTARTAWVTFTIRQISDIPKNMTIGAPLGGGIIFQLTDEYAKIVSLDEGTYKWSTKTDYMQTEANAAEGIANTDLFRNRTDLDDFPAVKWCIEHGDGWYMPSRSEMNAIIDGLGIKTEETMNTVNQKFVEYGGTGFTSAYYLTSCEKADETGKVWTVPTPTKAKDHSAFNKNGSARPVRAVKKITLNSDQLD